MRFILKIIFLFSFSVIFAQRKQRSVNFYFQKAKLSVLKKDYNSAIKYDLKALTLLKSKSDVNGIVKTYNYLSRLYKIKNNIDSSEYYILEGIKYSQNHPNVNKLLLSNLQNSYGMLNYEIGNFSIALQYYKAALLLRLQFPNKKKNLIWASFNNIGNTLLKQNNIKDAIINFKHGLASIKKSKSKNGLTYLYNNIAKCFYRLNKHDKAITYLDSAFQIYKSANSYFIYGKVYQNKKKYRLAKNNFIHALKIRKKHLPPNSYLLTETYLALANLYSQQLLLSKASKYYSLALKNQTISMNKKKHLLYTTTTISSLLQFAVNEFRVGQITNNNKEIYKALNKLEKAVEIIDFVRITNLSENAKLFIIKKSNIIYSILIKILFYLQNNTKKDYSEKILKYIEKSKVVALKDEIRNTNILSKNIVSDDIIAKEKYFRNINRNLLLAKPNKNTNNNFIKFYSDYKYFVNKIEKNYPKYYALKYSNNKLKLNQVRNNLNKKTAVFNYFLAKNKIYLQIITKNKIFNIEHELSESFRDDLNLLLKYLRKFNQNKFSELNKYISNSIISNALHLLGNKNKLIIIPSGLLLRIPFEVLINSNTGKYLIEDYSISYNYSVRLLFNKTSQLKGNDYKLIIASFKGFKKDYKTKLKYSRKEVEEINSSMTGYKTKILSKTELNKDFFLRSKIKTEILHFATHTIIDNQNYYNSKIVLSPNNTITLKDIYNFSLKANTVVLSSCSSGTGKLIKGEGVLSLTRGFLFNGTKNIIVSLWNIFDKHAFLLMQNFYSNLSKGISVEKALRNAKIALLHDGKHNFPGFWGSFILIGS